MKAKKLLNRLGEFLDADETTQYRELKATNKVLGVLKALKRKEASLKEQLLITLDPQERSAIQTKLDVIYAQRKKGVERVKQLKELERSGDGDTKDK
ncbi:hypothetical protein R0135_07980 [Congregibacter variabilis]|uniref:Uncharacterized protein n=1 Tax=Congregibacter variabilis TaxID=3081200 RepID=A0ABZ0I8F6_9GAMM|nr:hypothetical protein R0135_07980 [Congregibacter sp. IMCC43200]